MKVLISKCEIAGSVSAPSSKSYTIRGLICAALASGISKIIRPLYAYDTMAARDVLAKSGVEICEGQGDWQVRGGKLAGEGELYCGDSAATLRFMTAVCAATGNKKCVLTAGKSLAKRPVGVLVDALKQLGASCSAERGLPPVIVEGGSLQGGRCSLRGDVSSQYVSALLLSAPLARNVVTIELTTPPESRSYILMTLECLRQFGINVDSANNLRSFTVHPQSYSPGEYVVEGDWSSASYFLASGAVAGSVNINNLNSSSLQPDRQIVDLLQRMGADITFKDAVIVTKRKLAGIIADLNECIDLLPTMMAVAAAVEGTSIFTGIRRAKIKESDRVAAMSDGLIRLGVTVNEEEDHIQVTGPVTHGGTIDARSDHRIAMAFSILGLLQGGVTIEGAECVAKTYPEFWKDLERIGGKISLYNQ